MCEGGLDYNHLMSTYLQLLEDTKILDVKTEQILQETFIISASEVFLIFEDHCQLWDLDLNKQIYCGSKNDGVFFYTLPALVNRTTIALVRLENCDPQLEIYNIANNEVRTLGGFPDEQENFIKLFYFEATGNIVVTAKGKETRLYYWNAKQHKEYVKELPHHKFDENAIFDQYNNAGLVASYNGSGNTDRFNLIKEDGTFSTYAVNGVEAGAIRLVKEFSATEAVVGFLHNEKTSSVVLFNLTSGANVRVTSLTFPFDSIFRASESWVAIATVGDDEESNVKVEPVFSDEKTQPIKRDLGRGLRIWNDFMPIMTVSYEHPETEEKQRQIITRVMCAPKRSVYINFLEKAGVIADFGGEIVKQVINNFN